MKRVFFSSLALLLSILASAQKPDDWAGCAWYERANSEVEVSPNVVFIGNSITEGWFNADSGFFTENNGHIEMEHVAENIVSMSELARANNMEWVDYYSHMADGDGGMMAKFSEDGVHPNIEGYRVMESVVMSHIGKYLNAGGLKVDALSESIDAIVREGMDADAYPGCQVVVAQGGKVLINKCYGVHSSRTPIPVRETDMYDLASVTKTTATLLGVMRLYEKGLLDLDGKVSDYLLFYRGSDKEDITVRDLLFHESGLPSTIPFFYKAIDPASISEPLLQSFRDEKHSGQIDRELFISDFKYRRGAISKRKDRRHTLHVYDKMWLDNSYIDTLKKEITAYPYSGKYYQYSDIGFITLQWIVEEITGQALDAYVENEFYKPMGADRTLFVPARRYPLDEIVPTVCDDCLRGAYEICGYTQDEVAAYMGGVAGEAGLFSTASDLARIYQMFLNRGVLDGKRYFNESTVEMFTTEQSKISHRGLGFDRPNIKHPEHSPCVADTPASAYGHSGFTGPNVWVDPQNQLVYVFVCNRVSPYPWNNKLNDMGIFGKIQQAIYDNLR